MKFINCGYFLDTTDLLCYFVDYVKFNEFWLKLYICCIVFHRESCVGQLRHIYICTPEIESLVVSILPKIQPAPVPCPLFLPSNEGPIKLPSNGLWVLRLPYPLHYFTFTKRHCRHLVEAME